uniref:hypothetical protein n=1 Tax=Flavobacterium sp. TaxID=239 RepID=UPI00404AB8F2
MIKKLIFICLFSINFTYSQDVSCNDLLDYIIENATHEKTISKYILDSSWLNKIECYYYDGKYYVVADIKKNEYSMQTNKYIFCGISRMNWTNFKIGSYGDSDSYGERFHKYIFDYKCNCK